MDIKVLKGDKALELLGELLANETSRNLLKYLMNHPSTYKNKISNDMQKSFPLVKHHLEKMVELGLVEIKKEQIARKGNYHNHYSVETEGIYLLLKDPGSPEEEESILKRIFKKNVRIMSVGLAVLGSWFLSRQVSHIDGAGAGSGVGSTVFSIDWFSLNYDIWIPITAVSAFVLFGIILKLRRD